MIDSPMDDKRLRRIDKLQRKILSEWNYAVYVDTLSRSLSEGKDVDIILRSKPDLRGIKITKTLQELRESLDLPYPQLINMILRSFELEWRKGLTEKTKTCLNAINDYPDLTKDQKYKLVAFILEKLNIKFMEVENEQERQQSNHK